MSALPASLPDVQAPAAVPVPTLLPPMEPVPGFPGYHVTEDGRVYSTKPAGRGRGPRNAWMTQRPHPRTRHLRVDLRDPEGVKHTIQVQRLVAWAWLGEQPEYTQVCHRDGDPQRNHRHNLYYGTAQENAWDREWHREYGVGTERADYDDSDCPEYVPDPEYGF